MVSSVLIQINDSKRSLVNVDKVYHYVQAKGENRRNTTARRCLLARATSFGMLLLQLLVCFCLLPLFCCLSFSDPILWVDSPHKVTLGSTQYTVALKIDSGCEKLAVPFANGFSSGGKVTNKTLNLDLMLNRDICLKNFNDTVLREVRNFCTLRPLFILDDHTRKIRRRRSLLATIFVAGVTVLGVNSFIEMRTTNQYNSLRKQVLGYEQTTNELLKSALNGTRDSYLIMMSHDTILKQLTSYLENLETKIATLNFEKKLLLRFSSIAKLTRRVLSQFKPQGKVTTKFFTFFQGLAIWTDCPPELWEPETCDFLPNKVLVLTFRVKKVNAALSVLQSRAFKLAHIDNRLNGSSWCFLDYVGPHYALFEPKTKCAVPLFWKPIADHEPFIGAPVHVDCSKKVRLRQPWKTAGCFPTESVAAESIIQAISTEHNVFLYCPSFNVTYMGITHRCNQRVFRLRDDQSWKAGHFRLFQQHPHMQH